MPDNLIMFIEFWIIISIIFFALRILEFYMIQAVEYCLDILTMEFLNI